VNIKRGNEAIGKVTIPITDDIIYWEDLMAELPGKAVNYRVIVSVQQMFLNMQKVQKETLFEIPPKSSITAMCKLRPGVFFFVYI
jgi:hypothetical protein